MSEPDTKRCTRCGETKPLAAFYLRRAKEPTGPRRSHCKACDAVATLHRKRRGSSMAYQIVAHYVDPTAPLSPEAEAVIYTDKPPCPALLALVKRRQELARQGRLRRARELRKLAERNAMFPLPAMKYGLSA